MNAIVAVSPSWGIGRQGDLVYHLSEDMKYFRRMTSGKLVVMGRKTLDSFPGGKPLPKRRNLVLTRNGSFMREGAETVSGTEELLELIKDTPAEDVFVIGGGEIYRKLLPYCEKVYVTHVDREPAEKATVFFPDLFRDPEWTLTSLSAPVIEGEFCYRFGVWERIKQQKEKEADEQ